MYTELIKYIIYGILGTAIIICSMRFIEISIIKFYRYTQEHPVNGMIIFSVMIFITIQTAIYLFLSPTGYWQNITFIIIDVILIPLSLLLSIGIALSIFGGD